MRPFVLVTEIKRVTTGYIVRARYPFGDDPVGYGEVICPTLDDVFALVEKCDVDSLRKDTPR